MVMDCVYLQVLQELGLTPGKFCVKHAERCDKKREKQREKSWLPSTKHKRNVLKKERVVAQGALEVLSGDGYAEGKYNKYCNKKDN
jgi:hypothetical protein